MPPTILKLIFANGGEYHLMLPPDMLRALPIHRLLFNTRVQVVQNYHVALDTTVGELLAEQYELFHSIPRDCNNCGKRVNYLICLDCQG